MSEQSDGGGAPAAAPWCDACPLRQFPLFRDFSPDELRFMRKAKTAHLVAPAQTTLIREGEQSSQVFTLFTGWAVRYKILADGRRQILNVLLPGDTIGLYAALIGP